jgi:hypothetical protein
MLIIVMLLTGMDKMATLQLLAQTEEDLHMELMISLAMYMSGMNLSTVPTD